MKRRGACWLVLPLVIAVAGCGGAQQANGPDPAMVRRAEANQRLKGSWVLLSFKPEVPLEPMLQALLDAQFGHLGVQFDGQNMTAEGPGVETTRRYQVDDAEDDFLRVTTFDSRGVPYLAEGQFVGNRLLFHALTSPWRGAGTLARVSR